MARGKVAPKKNEEDSIIDKLLEYLIQRPEIYSIWEGADISDFSVLKKSYRTIKIRNDSNPFMIHEKCEEELFIVPIFINISKEKKSENQKVLKDFGCHFITIKSIHDIERKLESI